MADHKHRQQMLPGMEPQEECKPDSPLKSKTEPKAEIKTHPKAEPAGESAGESPRGKTVWVLDTHSLIYQVFHALPEMTSPAGEPVQAVFGVLRDVLALLAVKRPDYLFAAVDLPGNTFRHEIYGQYKIQRSAMPDDLVPQIPLVHKVFEALGVPVIGLEGFEADDIMATIARLAEAEGADCVLVTSDKDCRQLITDRVRLYNIRKEQIYDAESLLADWGICPGQVVDFQSLVGDPTDNVPGVPLIGPKIAGELLNKYETLEGVLDHAGEVSGQKRKQNLLGGRQQAMLSRSLVKLDANVDVKIDWASARVGQIDRSAVQELFDRYGFRRLGDQLDALAGASDDKPAEIKANYRLVDTPETLDELVAEMTRQDRISVDTETTNIWPRWAKIVGYSFSWKDNEAWYVPVRAPIESRCLDPDKTLAALRPVLEDPSIEKVGQNLKYDMIVLRSARPISDNPDAANTDTADAEPTGIEMAGVAFDTMVADYLLEAGQRNHNLDELAKRYLNHTTIKIDELIGKGKDQKRMDEVPVDVVADYAGEDALVPLRLRPILLEGLRAAGLEDLFVELELPLIEVLAEMEYNGIKVDHKRLEKLSVRYGQRIESLAAEIFELAGREFNIASPKQLQQILFEEQGLPVVKRTKTGPSTDAEVLAELALAHPLPAKIIEYRQYSKLKNTYVDALPEMINPTTGRVHASFNQVVTATGRLSSSDPNLQNIPIRTEAGREIRSAFVPGREGWVLMAADYSQIELRVLAHYSQDEHLCRAFADDEDIHARVASQVNSVPLEEVTSEMRRQAKAVNFGVIYGQSGFGLAKQLGIEREKADKFIEEYFAGYPGIEKFMSTTLAECRHNGYVSTILGRRRAIQGVRSGAGRQRNLAERTAINTVIQGSAADLIKQAMVDVYRRIRREKLSARMLLQIHDELVFEAPREELDYLVRLVTEEMVGGELLDVPLKVDVKTGPNWADAKPYTV